MNRVLDIMSGFPTVVFTAMLIVFLTWWLLSFVISGLDFDLSDGGDPSDLTAHGHSGTAHGHVGGHNAGHTHVGRVPARGGRGAPTRAGRSPGVLRPLIRLLGFGTVPLALGLTVFSFGGWAISLLGTLVWQSRTSGALAAVLAVATLVVSAFAGSFIVRRFAHLMAPIFDDARAPGRSDAHGAQVRVRTTYVDEHFGQAEVLDGPTRNNIVKVRAPAGQFHRGDIGMIIDFDEATESYALIELDSIFRLDP